MTYRKYLLVLAGTALVGWISFLLVIFRLDPCTAPGKITICHLASALALILFFTSAFFALTATFTLLGFGLRLWLHQYEIYLDHLNISLRQGLLLTFCTLAAAALLLLNALTWWSGLMLIAIILLLELYFTRGV
ncbi:hypothetical protein HYW83_02555 [Candidatus Peregrinibacteria bacterium]|nr:hypothetical protein [Candidatus Peregrinibacteria bacterium]